MRISSVFAPVLVAASAALMSPAHAESGYDGGFFIESKDGDQSYKLKLRGVLQTRLTWEDFEAEDAVDKISFGIARARLLAEGHFLTKALTYKFQADFGQAKVALKDFYWNYAFSEGVQLRAGQWKKPFSRQQITSSTRLALVDRASTDKAFGAGRDLGLLLHNDYEAVGGLEWAVGVFNGNGENAVADQWQPEALVRIGYSTAGFGKDRYVEGDLECADKPEKCGARFAVGLSAYADGSTPDDGKKGQVVGELDLILKVSGFELTGAFFADLNLGSEDEGGGLEKTGFYAQVSYFIAGPKLLPALRFVSVMPDDDAVATTRELTLGLGFLPWKHSLKWQTDATMVMSELAGASTTDWLIRTQAQIAF